MPRPPDADSGMTLRDWFAGQALSAIAEAWAHDLADKDTAKRAYEIADAMLLEREKP